MKIRSLCLLLSVAFALGAKAADDWKVFIDGRPLKLRSVDISIKENNEPEVNKRKKGDWFQYGAFTLEKPAEVRIACERPLDRLEVLPAKFAVKCRRVSRHEIAFRAAKPFRLSFRPEERVGALHLFANEPIRTDGVRRFGPGEHICTNIVVRSNETLLIDEGAVVYGHLDIRGTNILVCGNGIVSGAIFPRFRGPIPYSNCVVGGTNVVIRGVMFADPYTWTLGIRYSKNVVVDGVKIIGGRMINEDGIDVVNSSDVTIRNTFIRTQDDNICAKGMGYEGEGIPFKPTENLLVEGCELWTDQANNFRIGYESDAARMRNIRIRDVDVLAYSPLPRKFTDIWCHAVVKAQCGGGMPIEGIEVEKMRVHSDGGDVCLVYLAPHTTGTRRKNKPYKYTNGGTIRNCQFSDIRVYGKEAGFTGWIYLKGRNEAEYVRDIRFKNIRYFKRHIRAGDQALRIGEYADSVTFE